ncbi:MAG TPA: L,D-transpeptidase [Anaerolineales bacterium]|jgi:hypothetical protein|nr:L,D-transpeptidase [Anaerolineales bacterium]
MNQRLTILLIFSLLLLLLADAQPTQAAPDSAVSAGFPVAPLCLPEHQASQTADCQSLGPTAYLEQLESQGISMPRRPLPAVTIDPAFSELPYNYVRLGEDETPIFSTLDEAMANQNPYRVIPAGFKFVTFVDYYQGAGKGRHYMIEPGMWIRGGSTNGRVAPSPFNGLVFAGTPTHQFGWVLYQTESQTSPGSNSANLTGHVLNRYDIIQVYRTETTNNTTWLMIGPDEWIDKSKTALVYPALTPPEGVTNGRWIEVNLLEQTISVYQNNRLVFATLTSTGIPGWWTRPGLFQVTQKLESTPMSGAFEADRSDYYYLEDVPWTMYFDEARALHGAYWHNLFGYEQSHGCVNLSPGDSHWLYLWANVGDYVYVWDPSGQTPTDPDLYTAGGA